MLCGRWILWKCVCNRVVMFPQVSFSSTHSERGSFHRWKIAWMRENFERTIELTKIIQIYNSILMRVSWIRVKLLFRDIRVLREWIQFKKNYEFLYFCTWMVNISNVERMQTFGMSNRLKGNSSVIVNLISVFDFSRSRSYHGAHHLCIPSNYCGFLE